MTIRHRAFEELLDIIAWAKAHYTDGSHSDRDALADVLEAAAHQLGALVTEDNPELDVPWEGIADGQPT